MKIEDARKMQFPPIKVGEQYTFVCEIQQEYEKPEDRLRQYTGQLVTVIKKHPPGEEEQQTYQVRTENGTEFAAQQEEINGWDLVTGQFFWPDATWGHDHDAFALVNERG